MPAYRYVAVDGSGTRSEGELRADSYEAAVRSLQQEGKTLLSLRSAVAGGGDGVGDRMAEFWHLLRTRIPLKSVSFFTRQFATLYGAGLTVERALQGLSQQEPHPKFRGMLEAAASDIRKGVPLSEALGRHPGAFGRLYTALVKAGEAGGTLGTTLERLADYLERREDVRRKVISSLYYPVFVLIILGGAVAILLLKIAPMFEKVYRSFGADLPTPTKVLMNVSGFLVRYAPEGFFLSLLALLGLLAYGFTDRGRLFYDTLLLKLPVMGGLFLQSALATFARTLGLLMQSSVPVLDALALSSQTVGNSLLRNGVEKARGLVQDGGALTAGFRQAAVFPAIMLQLMATGEETGEVEKLLFKAADYYEKQVDALISRLTSLIEPVLIVLMAGVIGTLVIIIYLPIFYLGLAMRRGMH